MVYAAHRYSEAAIPEPYQILGIRLKPLSLHHCLLMQRFSVGFVDTGERDGTLEDLLFALLICSKQWEDGEFEEYVFSDKCEKDVQEWAKKVGEEMATTPLDIDEKIKLFDDYIKKHSAEPAYWKNETADSAPSGAHWIQCVLLTMTGQLGYTRSQALHAPLSQVLSDYFRHAESQGLVRLIGNEEWNRMEEEKKAFEEATKEVAE